MRYKLAALLVFGALFLGAAQAVPTLPHSFYGDITLNVPGDADVEAPESGTVTARAGGDRVGQIDIESQGIYGGAGGLEPKLVVQGDNVEDGDTIRFYVNGLKAEETYTFDSGNVTELDLNVTVPPPEEAAEFSHVEDAVSDGDTVDVEIPDAMTRSNGGATGLSIQVNNSSTRAEINVTVSDDPTDGGEKTEGYGVHGYIGVDTSVDKYIEEATIGFKLRRSAVSGPEEVLLLHYQDGQLEDTVAAEQVGENSEYYLFESTVTGFSTFGMASDTQDPEAEFTASDTTVEEGESITFDASDSSDNVGIESYDWDFGDRTGSGEEITHSYSTDGTYNVELTVTDEAGNSDTDSMSITVNDPPTTTTSTPSPGVEIVCPAAQSLDPGDSEVVEPELENTGDTDFTDIDIDATGDIADWMTVESVDELDSGDSTAFDVTVEVPSDAEPDDRVAELDVDAGDASDSCIFGVTVQEVEEAGEDQPQIETKEQPGNETEEVEQAVNETEPEEPGEPGGSGGVTGLVGAAASPLTALLLVLALLIGGLHYTGRIDLREVLEQVRQEDGSFDPDEGYSYES